MGKKEIGRKQPFLKRVLIFFIAIFAFAGMLSMFLCAINPLVSPKFFVWTSFFGLAFWPILFVNLAFLIVFILLKARKSLCISLLAIIIAVPGFMNSCAVKKEKTDTGNIKIMTYNVAAFYDINDEQLKSDFVKNDVISLINSEKPDIVCLQESGRWTEEGRCDFGSKIGCKYHSYNRYDHRGNIIFSRFPLEDDSFTESFNSSGASGFAVIVKAGALGRFYLENTHLQSYNITKDEIDYVGDTRNYVENSSKGKSILTKLRDAFKARTADTKLIVENIPESHTPIIICGDFNDTPVSFTYNQMRKAGLEDSFLEVGNGVGKTYCGKLPMLRIDYFWHGENIVPYTCKTLKKKISDHYPVVMTFNVIY